MYIGVIDVAMILNVDAPADMELLKGVVVLHRLVPNEITTSGNSGEDGCDGKVHAWRRKSYGAFAAGW